MAEEAIAEEQVENTFVPDPDNKFEIEVSREKFSATLNFVKSALPAREVEPELSNIYLKTLEDGKLQVVATDVDLMSVARCDAEIIGQGEVLINGEKILKLISKLVGNKITFKLVENDLSIICGTYAGTFKVAAKDTYPDVRTLMSDDKLVSIDKKDLVAAFKRIAFSVNTDTAKKNLAAIEISQSGAISTNGKITSMYRKDFGVSQPIYISSSSVNALLSVVEASDAASFDIFEDDAFLVFKFNKNVFFTRKIDIKFPPIVKKIDEPTAKANNILLKFKVKDFTQVLRRVIITASDESRAVRLKNNNDGTVQVMAEDGKGYVSQEALKLVSSENLPENFRVTYNSDFLLQILSKMALEEIILKVNSNIRMPTRIDEANVSIFLMRLVD